MTRMSFGAASKVNLPSKSVTVPLVVPFTTTLAPISGSFNPPSKTTPFMAFFCWVIVTSVVVAYKEEVVTETGKASAIRSKGSLFCLKIDL